MFSTVPKNQLHGIIDFSKIQTQAMLNHIVLECTHEWLKCKEKQGNNYYKSQERDYFLRAEEDCDREGYLETLRVGAMSEFLIWVLSIWVFTL